PRSRTFCWSGRIALMATGSDLSYWLPVSTRSSGSISSRTNASTQSSSAWNSGSVSKSHAMLPPRQPRPNVPSAADRADERAERPTAQLDPVTGHEPWIVGFAVEGAQLEQAARPDRPGPDDIARPQPGVGRGVPEDL